MLELDGKYIFGSAKVGEKGQIVIPKDARDTFGIRPGDSVMVIGDAKSGLALITDKTLAAMFAGIFNGTLPTPPQGTPFAPAGMPPQGNASMMPPQGAPSVPAGMPPQGFAPQNGAPAMPPQGAPFAPAGMPPQGFVPQSGIPTPPQDNASVMPPQGHPRKEEK